jgi:hypothetical protein
MSLGELLENIRIDLEVPLSTNPVTKNAAIVWPTAIDARLDHLLSLVIQQHRTDRRELAAAIIFSCPTDPKDLGEFIDSYRRASTRDALDYVKEIETANVFDLKKYKPGPRPRVTG